MSTRLGPFDLQPPPDLADPKSIDNIADKLLQRMRMALDKLDQMSQNQSEMHREMTFIEQYQQHIKQDQQGIEKDFQEMEEDQQQIKQDQQKVGEDQQKIGQNLQEIGQDQQEIEQDQKQWQKDLDERKQNQLQVQQSQKQIELHRFVVRLKLRNLFNWALGIGREQNQVERQLKSAASMEQIIRQHAALIHHNIPLIQANVQQTELADKDIESQTLLMETAIEEIESTIDQIEEIRDNIEESLSQIESKTETVEDAKEISDTLLNRIQETCLWVLANMCWHISQANQLLIKWAASSDLSLTQPRLVPVISWIALGALANMGMHEITFSLEDMTLKSSFREFTWMKDFAESYRSKAGG